jgi:ketosteroid isomerase-like protein
VNSTGTKTGVRLNEEMKPNDPESIDWGAARPVASTDLPPEVASYLAAQAAGDLAVMAAAYASDAVVVDDGKTYNGRDDVAAWLERSSIEYNYTITTLDTVAVDGRHVAVLRHLDGDFPGGTVNLWFRFTLKDHLIEKLVIEP